MMQTLLFLKNLGKHVLFKTCYRIQFPNFNWCTILQSCCRNSERASSLCFSSIFRTNSIIIQNLLLVVHYKKVTSVELKCIKFCRQSKKSPYQGEFVSVNSRPVLPHLYPKQLIIVQKLVSLRLIREERLLCHIAMVARFLDLHKVWFCKYGRKKIKGMTFLCMVALRNKTVVHIFLLSTEKAMAISVKKDC